MTDFLIRALLFIVFIAWVRYNHKALARFTCGDLREFIVMFLKGISCIFCGIATCGQSCGFRRRGDEWSYAAYGIGQIFAAAMIAVVIIICYVIHKVANA